MSQAGLNNIASAPSVATQYNADSGSAVPALGQLNIFGGIGIQTTGSGDTITVAQLLPITLPGAYPYAVLTSDYIILVDTSAARTIQLPNAPAASSIYVIKDTTGTASVFNISLTTVGGVVTIDGLATQTMTNDWQSITVVFDGTSYRII